MNRKYNRRAFLAASSDRERSDRPTACHAGAEAPVSLDGRSPGSVVTEDLIFWLTALHVHYRKKIVFVWNNLGGHKAAEEYFQLKHPDWFDFVALPTYSPELNPVESCWNQMKRGDLSNFTAEDTEALTTATVESARKISDDTELIRSFFEHAGLPI